jgi:predicted  nucleic acid-binding Zn-ribbon protein
MKYVQKTGLMILVCLVLFIFSVDKYVSSLNCLEASQEVAKTQAYRLVKLEQILTDANGLINSLKTDITRREKILEDTSKLLADLSKDNAELQTELDALKPLYGEKVKQLFKIQGELEVTQKKLDNLTEKMADKLQPSFFDQIMKMVNEINL